MNMMNREANSNAITEDLIIEIFSRLPEKSIFRFLCLSKQWKSIICSQYFIDLFQSISSSKPHLLVLREREDELDYKLFSSHQPLPSSPVATSFFRAKFSEYHIPDKCWFEGSYVSGLIYFSGDGERHGICNPSTNQYAMLPPIKHSYGLLGFDPIGKQFKVLLCKEERDDELVYHILTLGTKNERKREIRSPLTYGSRIRDHICINGGLYYRTYDSKFIGCFDVRSENFYKFEYPGHPFFQSFVNYKGKLGLASIYVYNGDDTGGHFKITIWVLEDFDKVEWKKHDYKVWDLRPELVTSATIRVIGVTDSGDIVLAKAFSRKPFYVYFFNPSDPMRFRRVTLESFGGEEENSDYKLYKIHYFMNHRANIGFDIMKKTTYAETSMYEPARTEASTSSSNEN